MNIITIAGALGKDAELRRMPNGDPVLQFSVADSQGKDKATIWWNCALWGKRGEALAQYLVKGQSVTVSGTVTEREYNDKDGVKRKAQDVRVNEVALQGGRRDEQSAAPKPAAKPAGSGFDDMPDSDIPW